MTGERTASPPPRQSARWFLCRRLRLHRLPIAIAHDVPLAPLTTLELGGPARHVAEAPDADAAIEALRWAQERQLPVFVLGGGSNVVIADGGFAGLVLRPTGRGMAFTPDDGDVRVEAQAGEPWDAVVAETVARNLAGLECLSGIPGLTGATPIQNVGAYGQDVAQTIQSVRVLDRRTLQTVDRSPHACGFSYRDSAFKRAPDRYLVLAVTFRLRPNGAPSIRYAELSSALAAVATPSLRQVREAVLTLRRGKSMVIDAGDPNRRSVGSFFTNPVVSIADADRIAAIAVREGMVSDAAQVPRFPVNADRVKLAAGWLIERAGISKGMRRGPVGISTRHALALVHHGGGKSSDLVALAREVRDAVAARFGITLVPEPVFLGVAF